MRVNLQPKEVQLSEGIRCFVHDKWYVATLPSRMCFFIPWAEAGQNRNIRQTLLYDLESEVPLNAEAMSVVHLGSSSSPSVVVVDGAQIAKVLDSAQELAGHQCLAVVPESLLAMSALPSPAADGVVLLCSATGCDRIELVAGCVTRWEWTAILGKADATSADVPTEGSLSVVRLDDCKLEGERSIEEEVTCDRFDLSNTDWRSQQAATILSGHCLPAANLNSGALDFVDPLRPALRIVQFAIATALLLGFVISAAIYWRGVLYERKTREFIKQQEEIYSELFPDQAIPIGITGRIESELRRLVATRSGSEIPVIGNTLPVMHAFWSKLPEDSRFSVSTIHIIPNQLEMLDGIARDYADLESLRSALNSAGFNVPPVSSSKTSSGVTLRWEHVPWVQVGQTALIGGGSE